MILPPEITVGKGALGRYGLRKPLAFSGGAGLYFGFVFYLVNYKSFSYESKFKLF